MKIVQITNWILAYFNLQVVRKSKFENLEFKANLLDSLQTFQQPKFPQEKKTFVMVRTEKYYDRQQILSFPLPKEESIRFVKQQMLMDLMRELERGKAVEFQEVENPEGYKLSAFLQVVVPNKV
jgi:hypothetical protein